MVVETNLRGDEINNWMYVYVRNTTGEFFLKRLEKKLENKEWNYFISSISTTFVVSAAQCQMDEIALKRLDGTRTKMHSDLALHYLSSNRLQAK